MARDLDVTFANYAGSRIHERLRSGGGKKSAEYRLGPFEDLEVIRVQAGQVDRAPV